MFAKLNKLRADHEKALAKLADAQKKVEEITAKVKQAEVDEVVNIAETYKLTPEKLFELVKGKTEDEGIKDVVTNKSYSPVETKTKNEDEEDILDEDI